MLMYSKKSKENHKAMVSQKKNNHKTTGEAFIKKDIFFVISKIGEFSLIVLVGNRDSNSFLLEQCRFV